mmetsp:Transcript_20683/g.30308  ORF Transcript_20683/g.30308 Transcript_20683/m.30308 type:complete len:236 (+) Transcript_20683:9860-10567(+)
MSGSCIFDGQASFPAGSWKMMSADLCTCLLHSFHISRGHMTMCEELCLLCRAWRTSSITCRPAAGGGAHKYVPGLYSGIHTLSTFLVPPPMSWPRSNHPSGSSSSTLWPSCEAHSNTHGRRVGDRSMASMCMGTCESIDSPRITPSYISPRDSPSVPWAIIRVPATWISWTLHLACISKVNSRTTNSYKGFETDEPFDAIDSDTILSVNKKMDLPSNPPSTLIPSSVSTRFRNSR